MYIYICIYIFILIERDRERNRVRDNRALQHTHLTILPIDYCPLLIGVARGSWLPSTLLPGQHHKTFWGDHEEVWGAGGRPLAQWATAEAQHISLRIGPATTQTSIPSKNLSNILFPLAFLTMHFGSKQSVCSMPVSEKMERTRRVVKCIYIYIFIYL